MTADRGAVDDGARMTFVEHLAELRSRLIRSLVAVAAGMVVGFAAYDRILDAVTAPYCDVVGADSCGLLVLDPLEGFRVRFMIAGYTGVALAMPVILWQVWRFVTPGLYPRERRLAVPFVVSALMLFALGAVLAFFTIPRALEFLIDIGGPDLTPAFRPREYVSFVTFMMIAFGVGFEFPVLLVFLQLIGVLGPRQLRRFRRYAIVIVAVLVAVITPSGDPISMLSLSVPLWIFYEVAIVIGRVIERRRDR